MFSKSCKVMAGYIISHPFLRNPPRSETWYCVCKRRQINQPICVARSTCWKMLATKISNITPIISPCHAFVKPLPISQQKTRLFPAPIRMGRDSAAAPFLLAATLSSLMPFFLSAPFFLSLSFFLETQGVENQKSIEKLSKLYQRLSEWQMEWNLEAH